MLHLFLSHSLVFINQTFLPNRSWRPSSSISVQPSCFLDTGSFCRNELLFSSVLFSFYVSLSFVLCLSSAQYHPHFLHGKNLTSSLLHPPTTTTTTRTHHQITFYPNNPCCASSKTGPSVPSAPPQDITCTSPSSTSILVSWAPPPLEFQNGVITGYSIQYSTTEGNKISKRIDGIPPQSSPYLLENLEKWTEYGITIRAQTEAGDGPESLQLLFRTEEDGMFPNEPPLPVLGWSAPLTMAS